MKTPVTAINRAYIEPALRVGPCSQCHNTIVEWRDSLNRCESCNAEAEGTRANHENRQSDDR